MSVEYNQGQYSFQHIAAFRKYMQVGSVKLTEADVEFIEAEDPASGEFIRRERAQAAEAEAAKRAASQPPAAPVAAKKPTWTGRTLTPWLDACIAYVCAKPANNDSDTVDKEVVKTLMGSIRALPHREATYAMLPALKLLREINEGNVKRIATTSATISALERRIASLESAPKGLPTKAYGRRPSRTSVMTA